jgi:hypothetical protein
MSDQRHSRDERLENPQPPLTAVQAGDEGARVMRWRDLVLGAALALLIVATNVAYVAMHEGLLHQPGQVRETDHYNYIAMTRQYAFGEGAPAARTAPYCWRILVPGLVALAVRAGASVDLAYLVLTCLALFLFLLTLFVFLRRHGIGAGLAAVGVALAGLTPGAVRWYAHQYWMTDPAALFLVVLGLLLSERRSWFALGIVSVAGVLARETYVLVLVYAAVREWRRQGLGATALRVASVAAAPLGTLVLLRFAITPELGGGLLATFHSVAAFRWRHLFDNQLYFATLGTFGVLLPLALVFPRRTWLALCRAPEIGAYVLVTYASLLLGVNTDRLLVYALPVILPLSLRGLATLAEELRLPSGSLAALALALQALLYAETDFLRRGISIYQPTNWTVTLALATFYLLSVGALALARRLGRPQTPNPPSVA